MRIAPPLLLLVASCLPASFPSDVLKEFACVQGQVEAGVKDIPTIMLNCKQPEEQLVIDAINSLLDSPSWVKDHPALIRDMVKMGGRSPR